jgi:hypothetical protein
MTIQLSNVSLSSVRASTALVSIGIASHLRHCWIDAASLAPQHSGSMSLPAQPTVYWSEWTCWQTNVVMQVQCLSLASALVRMSATLRCVGTCSRVTSSRLSSSRMSGSAVRADVPRRGAVAPARRDRGECPRGGGRPALVATAAREARGEDGREQAGNGGVAALAERDRRANEQQTVTATESLAQQLADSPSALAVREQRAQAARGVNKARPIVICSVSSLSPPHPTPHPL